MNYIVVSMCVCNMLGSISTKIDKNVLLPNACNSLKKKKKLNNVSKTGLTFFYDVLDTFVDVCHPLGFLGGCSSVDRERFGRCPDEPTVFESS